MSSIYEILGLQTVINWNDVIKLIFRFALDISFATVVIRFVYSRLYSNRTYVFTYFIFNIVTFCIFILMRKVPAELGFALAIFAVFGILRYRTEQIRIRDLTYLFIIIGIAIINAIAYKNISLPELLIVNAVIVGFTVFFERLPFARVESNIPMRYDRVDLLKSEKKQELHADIENRTGLRVTRIEIQQIDYLRDSADILIFYITKRNDKSK